MTPAPVVQFAGQSLRTLDDADLLQLLLRPDIPGFLLDVYNTEADRRMKPQPITALYTEALTLEASR